MAKLTKKQYDELKEISETPGRGQMRLFGRKLIDALYSPPKSKSKSKKEKVDLSEGGKK